MPRFSSLWFSFVLLFVFLVTLIGVLAASYEERKVHIVYMGALPGGEYSPSAHHFSMLQEVVDGRQSLVRSYTKSFNGFAAYLTDQERQKMASSDGVVSVFPSRTLHPQTTRSWDFMGFTENVKRNPTMESNIVVGVIDTGIWPESESFDDEGFGPPPKKWKGACNGGKNFTCNNKIIGARYYNSESPTPKDSARDTFGHGTHAASTAAGNNVKEASFYGLAQGTARGGVPSARIAVYNVCSPDTGCMDTDVLAAFDDAIADGVDIITISLGKYDALNLTDDSIPIGAFHAMERGILTVHAAGNKGFMAATVSSVAPWILSVAASNMDRRIVDKVVLGNGRTIVGNAVNSFKLDGTQFPLVYGKDVSRKCNQSEYPNLSDIGQSSLGLWGLNLNYLSEGTTSLTFMGLHVFDKKFCSDECLDSRLVKGKIVVCDYSDGTTEAKTNGALGLIAPGTDIPDTSFVLPLPASILSAKDFDHVRSYINSSKVHRANILRSDSIRDFNAPTVASFSSKGPNIIIPEILKPDISAPGVEILAAYSLVASPSEDEDKRSVKYNILSGTSMSCPHATGAATYVKSFHPDWSPSVIKSALMTTAWAMNATRNPLAEFSYGAGHIDPLKAIHPGLVYETFKADYIKMLCNMNYNTSTIRTISGDNNSTCPKRNKGSPKDLNHPSLAVQVKADKPLFVDFRRTVTNVGIANSTYKAIITKNSNLRISVKPRILSFKSLHEKKSFVLSVRGEISRSWESASLVWSDGFHSVRSPIIVFTEFYPSS